MLCYMDRTFCGSETHKPDCTRKMTPEEEERSLKFCEETGIGVAYSNFCDRG